MKISTKGRYALRIMLDLAEHNTGEYIPLKDVAYRQEITLKYLEQIISQLNKAGYLKSLRGQSGGYKLAKKPNEYVLGDILRSIEGSLTPVVCLDDNPNQCPRSAQCGTLPFWEGLNSVIKQYIDSITLEDLLQNRKDKKSAIF